MATIYVDADTRKAITNLAKLDKQFDKFGKNAEQELKKVSKGMNMLKVAGAAFAGVFAIGVLKQFAGELIMLGDAYTNIDSKIKLVTDSTAEFESVYQELYELGKETGSQLTVNAQSFSKLANAMPSAESADLVGYLETVNKSLTTAGVEAQEASAFMLQWSQAMGAGVVAGDELKSMVESNSYLMGKLAKSILGPDGTISALKKMGSEGTLTSELFAEHLGKISEDVAADFDAMGKTVARAWNEVTETLKDIFADANEGAGGTRELAEAISNVATIIEDNREGILSLFAQMIELAGGTVNAVGRVGNSMRAMAAVKAGEISFFDYMMADAEDLKVLLDDVKAKQSDIGIQEQKLQDLLTKRGQLEADKGGPFGGIFGDSSLVISQLEEIDKEIAKVKGNISREKAKIEVDVDPAVEEMKKLEAESKKAAAAATAAWEENSKEIMKLNQEIVEDFKSMSEEIRDIQREGMTDKEAWDDVLKQISEYQKLADAAGAAGNWQEQKDILDDIAGLYKSLPKDGVKGASPTDAQIKAAKDTLKYWVQIRDAQRTTQGQYTYDQKVQAAAEKLKQLTAEQKQGGKDLISAEESRKQRMEGIKSVQEEMVQLNERLKETAKQHGEELKSITDAFTGEKVEPVKKAMDELTTSTEKVGKAYVQVGDTWTNTSGQIMTEMDRQIRSIQQAEEAVRLYAEQIAAAANAAGNLPGGVGGTSNIPGFAVGGLVPGFGGTDSVLARLTPGEGVLTPLGLSALGGASALSQLNVGQNPFSDQSGDMIEMSFNFNKKSVGTLRGERASAMKILDQFSNMRRSLS